MQAQALISSSIKSIHPVEDGSTALKMMDQFRVNHLAVVKDNYFLAVRYIKLLGLNLMVSTSC